jgi:hypothetical protein
MVKQYDLKGLPGTAHQPGQDAFPALGSHHQVACTVAAKGLVKSRVE